MITIWIVALSAAVIAFIAGWFLRQHLGQQKLAQASKLADRIVEEAKSEHENLKREKLLEAKEEVFAAKQELEREIKAKRAEIQRIESQLGNREMNLDRKVDVLNKKEQELNDLNQELAAKEEYLRKKEGELESLIEEENQRLERISGLTNEEAKRIQKQNMLEKARQEVAEEIQQIREDAKKRSVHEAREIIMEAVQNSTIDHIVETTVSVIKLPDDEMKGRIIGREGRNIRAFESATGIEVLIDDTPNTVVLSGFDPMRREVAKLAMEKLIYDGRIHPGRIEEVVDKTREEISERIVELGEEALHEVGVHAVHHELVRMLGKQHFRTTYGQNLLQHSKEVAILAGEIATELGLDVRLAKRAGLLHDIGKAADEYTDMAFYEIGAEVAKKYGENEIVQNAIAAMAPGDKVRLLSPFGVIVKMANSISVSRPGAQKDSFEKYLKRMNKLEEISRTFPGVTRSYAIQAGKELRVLVEHKMVDERKAQSLAENISNKIKEEVDVPGQVRISVIREYRAIDFAK